MQPQEIIIFDSLSPCPYLEGQTARLPHRQPLKRLTLNQFDERLEIGDRRSGTMLYRPGCPHCQACEPIRLNLQTFQPNATQRRTFRLGEERLETRVGRPIVDDQRVELFNLHRDLRGLDRGDDPIDAAGYEQFLTDSCCRTIELSYWLADRLVGIAITDVGSQALSAVYCTYDPRLSDLSIGTYSVLKQVELCREQGRRYLYLGYYVAGSPHMLYKAKFHPHERRINGQWQLFP
ncbi:arginyl-tRNA-protein transferase [Anatilimnocola aggregata]|uniref:Aspartate/glutamate leucyltransferase n=1 Tax=Anatilimnocola aggregata TaxID=2528021 RepID=A0A517YDQ6_9BACT|nr:arginyltransferase [Anatilimnocola aggregata]QDU28360.1 arginyl-tRNA-protein transferase [Anatilimnocola aggregata]